MRHRFLGRAQDPVDLLGGDLQLALQIGLERLFLRVGTQDGLHIRSGQISHLEHQLLAGWIASQFLGEHALCAQDTGDRFKQMHGDADGPGLLGDRAVDRLPDPPGGVGAELEAAARVEFPDRTQETHVALLDQVEEINAAPKIALGNADDQAQVGPAQGLVGVHAALMGGIQFTLKFIIRGKVADRASAGSGKYDGG